MSMVGIAYVNNHNLDHPEIVDLLITGFSGTLRGQWDSYLPKDSKESIKHAVKKNDESFPIFDESIGKGIPDGVNTLIYTIFKHFVGTPSNILSQISDYLNNLRCPTLFDYRWYQDVFISRVLLRKDCYKPYWKKLGINMCNDEKLLKHQLKNKRKANLKWVIFVNNMVWLLLLLPSKRVKNMIKVTKIIAIKNIKNTEPTLLNLMTFMLKRKMFLKNMINRNQVKVNALTVENLDITVKTVNKNLVS